MKTTRPLTFNTTKDWQSFIMHYPKYLCELIWRMGPRIKRWQHQRPSRPPFYTSFEFTSSISQHGLIWNTSLRLQKSLYILSGQYFHCLLFPAAMTFLSDLCQPTATAHIDRTAKGSQAYLNPFISALLWPGLSEVPPEISLCTRRAFSTS